MKKKQFCGMMMLSAVLLLAGCTVDVLPESVAVPGTGTDDQVPVNFSVSDQLSLTRAATNIVTFDANEQLKVYVKPAGADGYTAYAYTTAAAGQSNVSLTAPTPPPYFPAGAGTTVEAYAYYPASAVVGETFSVAANQTADADYKASDLMFAANRTITKGSVEGTNLAMSHLMAQLHLNITGQGVTVSRVLVNAKRSVTFGVSAAGVPSTSLTGSASDITAATGSGDAYVCIPQQPINTVTVKVIAVGAGAEADRTATFSFTSTSDFVAGSSYPVNLTVSAAQLGTVTTISDWNGMESVTYGPTGDLTIEPISAVTYNGSAQTPSLTVKKDATTLTKDAADGYTCQWFSNTNAGTGIVVVLGQGTYDGSVAVAKFTINPKTLTADMVGSISAQTYTRSQITPAVTVTDGSALILNTDYTVSYGENVNVASGGSATVTGTGNYTGTVERNFTISPKSVASMTLNLTQTSATYTGSAITASVSSLMDGDYALAVGTEYTVNNSSTLSATNAAANASADPTQNTITVNGTGNYTGSKSNTWHINRATPTLTISTPASKTLSLTGASPNGTITVTRSGNGAVTATSSNTGVATTSVSGTTVKVTAGADGSTTITIQMNQSQNYAAYTASNKTVSVTASGFIPPPTGALPGKFQINSSGTQVYFSQGNLRATYDGSSWTWSFAENQWDYIGSNAANTSINGNGTVSASGTVDLFGWVGGSSPTLTGDPAKYGISNSNTNSHYGNSTSDALKSDWGTLAISNGGNTVNSGWRTLTKDEWTYIFGTNSGDKRSGSTVNGTANARYAQATINTDVSSGVNGVILFPDGVTIAADEATTWGPLNEKSSWGTKCTSAQWSALAAKGCVFLPAAGYRDGTSVYNAGTYGAYWSSSPRTSNANYAYGVYFNSSYLDPASNCSRCNGYSVRLVCRTDYFKFGVSLADAMVGMLVASNGKAYTSADYDTSFGDPVAVVGYKDGSNGYAIALVNSDNQTWNAITNSGANNNIDCTLADDKRGSVPAAPTGTTWKILTKDNYSKLFQAMGSTVTSNSSYYYDSKVNGKITVYSSYGGTALSGGYCSTTASGINYYWGVFQTAWITRDKDNSLQVRPVLAW